MTTPPANWYPDPKQSGRFRYFDGTEWTDHYHVPESPVQDPAPGSEPIIYTPMGHGAEPIIYTPMGHGAEPIRTGQGSEHVTYTSVGQSSVAGAYGSIGSVSAGTRTTSTTAVNAPKSSFTALLGHAVNGAVSRFIPILGVSALMVVLVGVLGLLLTLLSSSASGTGLDQPSSGSFGPFNSAPGFSGLAILLVIAAVVLVYLLVCFYGIAVVRLLLQFHLGRRSSIGDALRQGASRMVPFFFTYIGANIILSIIGLVVLFLPLLLLADSAGALAVPVVMVLFVVLYVVSMVYLGFLLQAGAATRTGESILGSSMAVASGRFFRTLGAVIVLALPMALISVFQTILVNSGNVAASFIMLFMLPFAALIFLSGMTRIYAEQGPPVRS